MGNGDAHCVGAAVAPQVGAEIGVRAVPGPPCPRMPHDVPSTGGDRPIPMQGALGRDLCTHISIGICTLSSVGFSLQAPSPRVGDDGEVGRRRTPPPPSAQLSKVQPPGSDPQAEGAVLLSASRVLGSPRAPSPSLCRAQAGRSCSASAGRFSSSPRSPTTPARSRAAK